MNKKIFLASPHMGGEELIFANEAFESNWIAPLGPNVDNFEQEVANHVDIKSAAALSSGTAAIHLALKALNVGEGDVVFCSSLTFSASCNPIIYQNATPVFIDSDYETWNMCPIALEKALKDAEDNNKIPKAIIVVHLYGQSADFDRIKEICDQYSVPIIEDAAESLGATYKGKQTGTLGELGIFSFNGNKIITTSGGGMLVSDNEDTIQKVKFWATQSREQERHYEHMELGFNYRMSNILAGVGRGQIRILNQRIEQKKRIYENYQSTFKSIEEIEMMPVCNYGEPNYWLSVMTLSPGSKVKPLDIMVALEQENIESRPVWKPMHLQPFYSEYKFFSSLEEGSIAEDLFNRGVCLPSDTKMTEADMDRIVNTVKGLF